MPRKSRVVPTDAPAVDAAPADHPTPETVTDPSDATSFASENVDQQPAAGRSPSAALPPLGRGWTQRYEQPVKYAHSTFKDAMGETHIAFRFDLPPGQPRPDDEILAVMRDHKFFKDGKPNGLAADAATDPESYPTGSRFDALPRGGKAWLLPDTPMGRTVADSLDQALDGLAKKSGTGVGGPG